MTEHDLEYPKQRQLEQIDELPLSNLAKQTAKDGIIKAFKEQMGQETKKTGENITIKNKSHENVETEVSWEETMKVLKEEKFNLVG
jgi:DUF2075 family protein